MSHYHNQLWGFAVYRTYYGDDELWKKTKTNLERSRLRQANSIEHRNPGTATYAYIEDEAQCNDKTPTEIRLMFNPGYGYDSEDEDNSNTPRDSSIPLPDIPECYRGADICQHICLVIDKEAMESIVGGVNSYLIAVDTNNHDEYGDGTAKLGIDAVFGEFYGSVGENDLIMSEIGMGGDEIWSG